MSILVDKNIKAITRGMTRSRRWKAPASASRPAARLLGEMLVAMLKG